MDPAYLLRLSLQTSLIRSTRCRKTVSLHNGFSTAKSVRIKNIFPRQVPARAFSRFTNCHDQVGPAHRAPSQPTSAQATPTTTSQPSRNSSQTAASTPSYPPKTAPLMSALGLGSLIDRPGSPQRRSTEKKLDDLFAPRPSQSKPTQSDQSLDWLMDFGDSTGLMEGRQRSRNINQMVMDDLDKLPQNDPRDAIQLRLKPALGRTVDLESMPGGPDLNRALRTLETRCSQNKVRADERKQRTYVRRGQQKKYDRMNRWRKLFKDGFLAECSRIRRMRRQGW